MLLLSPPQEGEEFRRALIRYESEMLKAFGFIMNVEHPHRLLCNYCQILFAPYMEKRDKQGFLQTFIQESWNVANDRCARMLCRDVMAGAGRAACCLQSVRMALLDWCVRVTSAEGRQAPLLCMGACWQLLQPASLPRQACS